MWDKAVWTSACSYGISKGAMCRFFKHLGPDHTGREVHRTAFLLPGQTERLQLVNLCHSGYPEKVTTKTKNANDNVRFSALS